MEMAVPPSRYRCTTVQMHDRHIAAVAARTRFYRGRTRKKGYGDAGFGTSSTVSQQSLTDGDATASAPQLSQAIGQLCAIYRNPSNRMHVSHGQSIRALRELVDLLEVEIEPSVRTEILKALAALAPRGDERTLNQLMLRVHKLMQDDPTDLDISHRCARERYLQELLECAGSIAAGTGAKIAVLLLVQFLAADPALVARVQ